MEMVGSVADYYDGSFKSAKSFKSVMVSLRRWMNEGGLGQKFQKFFQILGLTTTIASFYTYEVSQIFGITSTKASFDTYEGSGKSVKSVQMERLRTRVSEGGWVGGAKVSQLI